ncbi:MAG: hypothetical protein AVDCRST_MAG80-161, partial [uncultured Rubrobacteraceae bacterium]
GSRARSPARLRRYPTAATGRAAVRSGRRGDGRVDGTTLGVSLPAAHQRAFARLPRLPDALGQGAGPPEDPAGREGAAPPGGGGPARRGLGYHHPLGRSRLSACGPALLRPRNRGLRAPRTVRQPLAARGGRGGDPGVPSPRLRPPRSALRTSPAAGVVGEGQAGPAHAPGVGARRARRGRDDLGLLRRGNV